MTRGGTAEVKREDARARGGTNIMYVRKRVSCCPDPRLRQKEIQLSISSPLDRCLVPCISHIAILDLAVRAPSGMLLLRRTLRSSSS
jgi:hypothetical protein